MGGWKSSMASLSSEKLLIVGGTGFIGRHLVLNAVKRGYSTVVVSLNPLDTKKKIDGVEYLQADIINLVNLKKRLKDAKFEYVVNLSGYIDHGNFLEGGRNIIDAHFVGVQNLLQTIDWSVLKRFVQIGSSDEYGSLPAPQSEEIREKPISSYSLGKLASTQLLQMLHRTEGLPAVTLRLFLVYGPGQNNRRFLPQIIKGCLSNSVFPTSAGEQLRDFCYVDDITDGILSTLIHDKVNGEVINLASGSPIAIRDVVEQVQQTIGKGVPEFGKIHYRAGENMALYANVLKAKKLLGWSSVVTLQEGVRDTVNYYKKQKF